MGEDVVDQFEVREGATVPARLQANLGTEQVYKELEELLGRI